MRRKLLACVLLLFGLFLSFGLAGCVNPKTTPDLTPLVSEFPVASPSAQPTGLILTDAPATLTPAAGETLSPAATATLPPASSQTPFPAVTGTATNTPDPAAILEGFNGSFNQWQVLSEVSGSGSVVRTSDLAFEDSASARLVLSAGSGSAALKVNFRDAALEHTWAERPGTWNWFRAYVYLPASTVAQLGAEEYLTLGGISASGAGCGWYLRLRQNGALTVVGHRDWDNTPIEFQVYGVFPQDRWVQLELGLHSQNGPGVKRAFAFLIDGDFYGWYHQGRMKEEVYDTAAIGILSTDSSKPLTVFVDEWFRSTQDIFPGGSDNRSSNPVQEQDFRSQSGLQWQIDWTSWENNLRLDPQFGLYSLSSRFQAGRNLDRMPGLESGWAEIEIDWPQGTPPGNELLAYSFGGLIAFRKEINREENLEVGYTIGDGVAQILYDGWTGGPLVFGQWKLPQSGGLSDGRNLPEPGDVLRVRWEQVGEKEIHVQVSFFDASAGKWYPDVIADTRDVTSLPDEDPPGEIINFMDGYHLASAVTADTPYYSIRRYRVGTLGTYPQP